MKVGRNIITSLALFLTLQATSLVLAEGLNQDCKAFWVEVCLDPGHGGPSAQKYGNNGDGRGAYGRDNNLSEQWINMEVALAFQDTFYNRADFWCDFVLTRNCDTCITKYPEGLYHRADLADTVNNGNGADEFISIHHNGFSPLSSALQGTESLWSSDTLDSSSYSIRLWPSYEGRRVAADPTLANKIKLYVWGRFNATVCWGCYQLRATIDEYYLPPAERKYILHETHVPSAISEASDISKYADEAARFGDRSTYHIEQEAGALVAGWISYRENAGFVYIDYKSLFGNNPDDRRVLIDGELAYVPWHSAWNADSYHWLEANWQTNWGDSTCYFHHWEEKETGLTNVARECIWFVPDESTHTYIAYYKGGPYDVGLFAPLGGEYWTVGDTAWILLDFGSTGGIENSALIDIWLDRNGGGSGYPNSIVQNYLLSQGISIPIMPSLPGSNNCKVKVWSRDLAENQAYTYSAQPFYLYLIGDVNQSDAITIGDIIHIINYIFNKPNPPCETNCWPIIPLMRADATGDCNVTMGDAVYLVNYVMKSGPRPVRCPGLPSARTIAASK